MGRCETMAKIVCSLLKSDDTRFNRDLNAARWCNTVISAKKKMHGTAYYSARLSKLQEIRCLNALRIST